MGEVASPLLANIALHGLETAIRAAFPTKVRGVRLGKPVVIRYADDFVVLHPDLAVIEEVQRLATAWLAGMGLELKPSKTRITHTLTAHDGHCGFDFLGFQVRQHRVGKTHSGRIKHPGGTTLLGFKTIITPSKDAQRRHQLALGEVIRRHKMAPQDALVGRLNPVIRGWTNYYATVCAKDTFARMSFNTYHKLWRWARYRHPNKAGRWIAAKYWRLETGQWRFGSRGGPQLAVHDRTPIRRFTKVQGARSPFDGDWVYWATRLGRHPALPRSTTRLLRLQGGRCARCAQFFRHGDALIEVDHRLPRALGGGEALANRQLLHGHCHDQKTAQDGSAAVGGARDRSRRVEEPDAGKLACPVL